jgi:dTDP-4-amino-4,6-dideoxygalactose transaminase
MELIDNVIPFNKPSVTGIEIQYIQEAINSGALSGNGVFTKRNQDWFEKNYNLQKTLLTSSCTDALEMSAILCEISPGDEVILPSYTFVSTANAFKLRGANLIFVDSRTDHPGMDESKIEELITERTKAIVPVHYAGVACEMEKILEIASIHNLFVVEDAAQAINSSYKFRDGTRKQLGSIGNLGTFSFHETKNINCGEGGLLIVNDSNLLDRAEIIWEKGTNRSAFFRGEVDKYGWVDLGSSYLPSELSAAFLTAQLEHIDLIQQKRLNIWNRYFQELKLFSEKNNIKLPFIPEYAENNGHMFYLICESLEQRTMLIKHLKNNNIHSVFHYQSLNKSDFFRKDNFNSNLINSDRYSDCLLRLPLYYDLSFEELERIIFILNEF